MENNENTKKQTLADIDESFFSEFTVPTYEEWVKLAEKALKGAPFEKMMITKTYEDIDLQPIYTAKDTEDLNIPNVMPGASPYHRGVGDLGYIQEAWRIAQECDQISPEDFNDALKVQLDKGCSEINMVLNELTLEGKNINNKEVEKVAEAGLVLTTLDDMNTALSEVDIEKYPIQIFAGASAFSILAMYKALFKSQGRDIANAKGCIGADPIGVLAKNGKLESSLENLYDQMATTIKWTNDNSPNLKTILIQGHSYHNAGASAIHEMSYVFATAINYIREMQNRGLEIDVIAPKIHFSFSVGTNFFMEIGKIRAARTLWSQIVSAFGGNEESQKMTLHCRTSGYNKTVYDPYVNMLRTTTESFSAVVGGIDSLHVSYFDEAIKPSDEFSRRISRNTHVVLQEECNLTQPIDPSGGSWYIESLTRIISEKTWEKLQEIEKLGGMLEALKQGLPQKDCSKVAEKRFTNLSKRKDVIVGVNMYPNMAEEKLPVPEKDYVALVEKMTQQLEEYKNDIDMEEKNNKINKLKEHKKYCLGCTSTTFLVGATLEEVKDIIDVKAELIVKPLEIHRISEKFESIRKATESYKEFAGKNVKVFLANIGPIPQHKGRADFSTGFFEVGAFEVLNNDGFEDIEDAAQAAADSGAEVAVICSSDSVYPEVVPPLAKRIKELKPDIRLFLAGKPAPEMKDTYTKAGVDDYVHVGADVYKIITTIQKERGVI